MRIKPHADNPNPGAGTIIIVIIPRVAPFGIIDIAIFDLGGRLMRCILAL